MLTEQFVEKRRAADLSYWEHYCQVLDCVNSDWRCCANYGKLKSAAFLIIEYR